MDAAWILAAADARLERAGVRRFTLAPERTRARTLSEIGDAIVAVDRRTSAHAVAWARALATVAEAMHDAFPENLLWDLDALGAALWAERDGPDAITARGDRIAVVQARFGRHTTIAFRYVHDFTYGFDWAKWVAREPEARGDIGPYDPPFVESMIERAGELADAIANRTDDKYPPLPDGRPRNPFGFSREPADELRLLQTLAARDQVPVPAWRTEGTSRWDLPYAELRDAAAVELGV